ncbi:hypothetical protein AADM20_12725, partial [Erwinia amylovora]
IAPGYCIVERPGNLDFQARELFRDTRSPAASLFMKLNADTQWLKPGQILIVADPDTTAPVTTQMLHAWLLYCRTSGKPGFPGAGAVQGYPLPCGQPVYETQC